MILVKKLLLITFMLLATVVSFLMTLMVLLKANWIIDPLVFWGLIHYGLICISSMVVATWEITQVAKS